jgi:hypothetical protein
MGRAIRVLKNIDSETAASVVLSFLLQVESLATDNFNADERAFVNSDLLLQEYDQCRTVAYSFADANAFNQFLADLRADDVLVRTRAIHALEAASHLRRQDVSVAVIERLRDEADPVILARLLWQGYQAAQHSPGQVIAALSTLSQRLWTDYGTTAAAFSLLEALVTTDRQAVIAILPEDLNSLPVTIRSLLGELLASLRIRGAAFDIRSFNEFLTPTSTESIPDNDLALLEFHQLRARASAKLLSAIAQSQLEEWPVVWRLELRDRGVDLLKFQFGTWIDRIDIAQLPQE